MTPTERVLFARLVGELASSFTKLGHPRQTVEHESLGLCSWRSCSRTCHRRRALFLAAADVLEHELELPEAVAAVTLVAGLPGLPESS